MQEQKYRIVFKGELLEGASKDHAREQIAAAFKLNTAAVEKLFSGKTIVIKKNIDEATARKYYMLFKKAGARCRVLKEQIKQVPPSSSGQPATVTCHKCSHVQPASSECERCGIVFRKIKPAPEMNKLTSAPSENTSKPRYEATLYNPIQGTAVKDLVKSIEKGNRNAKKLVQLIEDQAGNPEQYWPAYLKAADILAIINTSYSRDKAQELLNLVREATNDGRPETFRILALLTRKNGLDEESQTYAKKALPLYAQLFDSLATRKEKQDLDREVAQMMSQVELPESFVIKGPTGAVVSKTEDLGEVLRGRRKKKYPANARIEANSLGAVSLSEWRQPNLFTYEPHERPIYSRAINIAFIFGLIGFFYFLGNSWANYLHYLGEAWAEFQAMEVNLIMLIVATILLWQFWLIIFLVITFFMLCWGFFAGIVIGFVPALLISVLLQPIMGKRN